MGESKFCKVRLFLLISYFYFSQQMLLQKYAYVQNNVMPAFTQQLAVKLSNKHVVLTRDAHSHAIKMSRVFVHVVISHIVLTSNLNLHGRSFIHF